jgi:hypothetical protein
MPPQLAGRGAERKRRDGMSDAPDRIYAMYGRRGKRFIVDDRQPQFAQIEYIRADSVQAMIDAAVAKEREACAMLVDDMLVEEWDILIEERDDLERLAEQIRARNTTPAP